ncbi:hypothetical protein F4055_13235, partial [Candidatus Poribacteria bacterium]|nr:hypothetical protein [Candidatus Poribacteria bacterium]
MRKTVVILTFFLFSVLAVMLPEVASAQSKKNTIVNQTTENVSVVYATWRSATNDIPEGYLTRGHISLKPDKSVKLTGWKNDVYFQILQGGEAIKPAAAAKTFGFWVHPSKGFVVVSPRMDGSVLRDELTYTKPAGITFTHEDGFIRYPNGSVVTVDSSWVSVSEAGETDPDKGLSLDVNGDGVINASDVAIVAALLGSSLTEADVNGDGIVTVDDIKLVSDAIGADAGGTSPNGTQQPTLTENTRRGEVLCYTGQTWWIGKAAAKRESLVTRESFALASGGIQSRETDDQNEVRRWMLQTMNNGVVDVLILYGDVPETIYPTGNGLPDGSVAERWLETPDGDTILNHADWIFWGGENQKNREAGLQNIMDLPHITMWSGRPEGDGIPMKVTAKGKSLIPSLRNFLSDRPFRLDELGGAWFAELILA